MIDKFPLGFHTNQALKAAEVCQFLNQFLFFAEE